MSKEAWKPEEPDGKMLEYWDEVNAFDIAVFKNIGVTAKEATDTMVLLCKAMRGCIRKRKMPKPRHKQIDRAIKQMRRII